MQYFKKPLGGSQAQTLGSLNSKEKDGIRYGLYVGKFFSFLIRKISPAPLISEVLDSVLGSSRKESSFLFSLEISRHRIVRGGLTVRPLEESDKEAEGQSCGTDLVFHCLWQENLSILLDSKALL